MNLRDLEYAVCLAAERQFRRAAERCHVSQPTLSTQIAKLEDELGVQLFERGPRVATPTVNGRALIRQAQIVLDEVERLKALARAGEDPLQGPFHLGVIPTAGPYLLPLLLPVLRQHWPQLQLLLREELTAGLLDRLRAQAAQPDLVYISSYPSDTVGILRSVGELGLDTKMLGGGLAGLQVAAIKMQLGPAANGIVNVDLWEPVPTMQFPGVMDFIKKYQAKAPAEGVDLLGYFLPPFAYSELQILGDAITATKSIDDDKLAQFMHSHPFHTIEGDIAFGPDGEWTEARPIWVQYHGIKGHDVEQFRGASTVTILATPQYKTGEMVYPYTEARQ